MFDGRPRAVIERALIVTPGDDVALFASGMMLSTARRRPSCDAGVSASVVNVPVIKPLDPGTVAAASTARAVITAENHSVIGGLGTAVAEVLAEAGLGRPLRRSGSGHVRRRGAERPVAVRKYGLSTQDVVDTRGAPSGDRPHAAAPVEAQGGEYSPV